MKYNKSVYQILALFTQFTINMLVPIFLCSFIGYYVDQKLNTNIFFIILFFLGALSGFRNVYILAKKTYTKSEEENLNEDRKK